MAELIPLLINLSMGFVVLALGLGANWSEAIYLLRHPGLLIRSLLAMNVIMPLFAAVLVALLDLQPAIEIAIVAIALSPVPPILPSKQVKAGGTEADVVSLLAIAAVCALVIVPLGVQLFSLAFGTGREVPLAAVLSPVIGSVIAPLAIGLIARQLMQEFAERCSRYVAIAGTVLLILAFLPVLFQIWPALMAMVGNGTLLVLALFTVVGLAAGHFLGGPDPDNRTVLALATGTRHPGVALAIATATFPEQKAVIAIVLWHLVVGAIMSIPYVKWRQRTHAASHAGSLS